MKIAILGYGREGRAVLDFLKRNPKYDFARIWILDRNPALNISREDRRRPGPALRTKLGKNYLKNLDDFDLIFRSPGVPYNLPEVQAALKKNTLFSSATKLFFEHCSSRIIGITGTKGKGTTTALLYQILKNAGLDAHLAGNIGHPALYLLPHLRQHSLVVLELSSFQLQDLTISPAVAVVLHIFPDHLDVHATLKEYFAAKANIGRYQTQNNALFFFRDDKLSRAIAARSRAKKIAIPPARFSLFTPGVLKIPGEHNFQNAVMAAAVALHLGCPPEITAETCANFTGLEHRLELVRRLALPLNTTIDFYNDSASTNPQTALAAISSFRRPLVLLAGGSDKNLDYAPLGQTIKKTSTELAILYGQNREKIKKALKRFPLILCETLGEAVQAAVDHCRRQDGERIILLSPGAASFDQFRDYAHRGQKFKEIVNSL